MTPPPSVTIDLSNSPTEAEEETAGAASVDDLRKLIQFREQTAVRRLDAAAKEVKKANKEDRTTTLSVMTTTTTDVSADKPI